MNEIPDLERIIRVICASIKSVEDKAIVAAYFRDRDSLTPEGREKAANRIKETLSVYPEFEGINAFKKYGLTEEKLEAARKKYGLKLDYTESLEEIASVILKADDTKKCSEENPEEDINKNNSLKARMHRTYEKYTQENEEEKDGAKENLETIDFQGKKLCKNDYDAIQSLARQYFGKTAEEYFTSRRDPLCQYANPWSYNKLTFYNTLIQISINNRITQLNLVEQKLQEIPKQVNQLTQLNRLNLSENKISKIENLDKLYKLGILLLINNPVNERDPELIKLKNKGIEVITAINC